MMVLSFNRLSDSPAFKLLAREMFAPTYNKETRVWSGLKLPPLFNPSQGLGQLIVNILEMTPEAISQISADTGVSVTNGEMRDRILKIAIHLNAMGVEQGDVIGVVAANTEFIAPTAFACFYLGLPINPCPPTILEADLVRMFSQTRPKLILCDANNIRVVQRAAKVMESDAKILTVSDRIEGVECIADVIATISNFSPPIAPHIDADATVAILSSSGSTGLPKGVCKSHREMITMLEPIYMGDFRKTPIMFVLSPLFWISGFGYTILSTLCRYTRVITAQPYEATRLVEILKEYKVSVMMTSPSTVHNLLQSGVTERLPEMRVWLVGGARFTPGHLERLRAFAPSAVFAHLYACTEQNVITRNYEMEKLESCGSPAPNMEIMIADDDGIALPNGVSGEIFTRPLVHFNGYLGEPERTREAFAGDWFKTGDIGYMNDEGCLYVTDRKKDLIKVNRLHVNPSELESVINAIEGVASSCVIGLSDTVTGNDVIHACVVGDGSVKLSESQIANYVNERVSEHKRLSGGVHLLSDFPLGITGKVDRKTVRDRVRALGKMT